MIKYSSDSCIPFSKKDKWEEIFVDAKVTFTRLLKLVYSYCRTVCWTEDRSTSWTEMLCDLDSRSYHTKMIQDSLCAIPKVHVTNQKQNPKSVFVSFYMALETQERSELHSGLHILFCREGNIRTILLHCSMNVPLKIHVLQTSTPRFICRWHLEVGFRE
jgi:hypothetical protein